MRFDQWEAAHKYAQGLANDCHQDVAIRAVKEFGRAGFNVSFASRNDSDYARAEIVNPQSRYARCPMCGGINCQRPHDNT